MQTKHRVSHFFAAMVPAFVIAGGMLALGQLPPPYSLIGAVLFLLLLARFKPWNRWAVLSRLRRLPTRRPHVHVGN
jgi:hypothetical protein